MILGRDFCLPLTVLLCVVAIPAHAQTTGILRGVVRDPTRTAVPGAKATMIQEGTNIVRHATADNSGAFTFPALPAGSYQLEVEAKSFKKYVDPKVEVRLGHVAVIDAQLELGTLTQTVTASGTAPLLETSSTQLGAVVNHTAITALPLNERDTYQLLQLQPGVTSEVGANLFYGSDQPGAVSVNGGRGRANNFMVNGGDANDLYVNLPGVQPSPDTIQEFRVLTNTFDAEFGRNSSAIVNVVTKSGKNQVHGDLYEFLRNKVLNARGFFDANTPDFKQNQFGGTLGGPIQKNRTFFFGSYEGRRIREGIPSDVVTVPTSAERQGNFSAGPIFTGTLTDANVASLLNRRPGCAAAVAAHGGAPIAAGTKYAVIFPSNMIPAPCFDATAQDLLSQFVPAPNFGANQFQTVPVSRTTVDQSTERLDHNFTENQRLSAYYYYNDSFQFQPFSTYQASGANLPSFGGNTAVRNQQVNLSDTWVLSPAMINEARFAYYREGEAELNAPERTNLVQNSCRTVPASQCFSDPQNPGLGITPGIAPNLGGVPYITLAGSSTIGNNIQGQVPQAANTFQWTDTLTKVTGNHTLKFGTDIRRYQFNQLALFGTTGGYYFFGGGPNDPGYNSVIPNYLLGLPDQFVQGSPTTQYLRSTALYLYGQDSWKVRSNVTLNLGLRWELNPPFYDRYNRIVTFRPGQNTTVYPCQFAPGNPLISALGTTNCNAGSAGGAVFPTGLVYPGDPGVPRGLSQTSYKAFAPRIGLAWSPAAADGWIAKLTGGPGKSSVRLGYGISYNPVEQLVYKQFNGAPPFGAAPFLSNILFNTPYEFQNGATAVNPFPINNSPPPNQPVDWSIFRPTSLFGLQQAQQHPQYVEQYNFTLQRELTPDMVLQIAYVGSEGHHLNINHDLNYGQAQTCLDLNQIPGQSCGPFGADRTYRIPAGAIPPGVTLHLPYGSVPSITGPNRSPITLVGLRHYSSPACEPTTGAGCPIDGVPVFGSLYTADDIGNSNYNSLQISLERRLSRGLQLQASYTWSKSFDYGSSFEDTINPLDFRAGYALSQFDARHRFVASYLWQLPIPHAQGVLGTIANGWSISGITILQSGFPIRITSNADIELQNSFAFLTAGEPNMVAPFRRLDPRAPGHFAFDPASFAQPAQLGVIGNSPRTVCCGPGIANFDFAVLKNTALTERTTLQFRSEFFNLLNHSQFENPDGNISDTATFGTVVQARPPREIQFALKLIF